MEIKLNNQDIFHNGDFNSNQVFFIQRWAELLNILKGCILINYACLYKTILAV